VANLQLGEGCWRVRGLLTAKANPNPTNTSTSPIQIAIARGNVEAFYALLHAGATCESATMRCAVKSGSAEMVRSVGMLNHAEEPDLVDVASRSGFVDILEVLVNELGYTLHDSLLLHPVYRAIEKGQCDVVDFFFQNDPSLAMKRYRDGRNALTVAAAAGQSSVIELLVKKYGMQAYDMDVLCAAARHDRPLALRTLGALINDARWMETADREGDQPMMAAMRNGGYVAMMALAEMGADPFDVLFELARNNKKAVMKELLGVLIDKQERIQEIIDARREKHSLLSWASIHGSFDCALMMMRKLKLKTI
jgi:ankyrin repeat protein